MVFDNYNKMCELCEINPVYEFTNKRKLCKRCFINYFNKKFLFCIRKFHLISKGDRIYLIKSNDFRSVVLKKSLKFFKEKLNFEIVEVNQLNNKKVEKTFTNKDKIALASSIDSESERFLDGIINKNLKGISSFLPKYNKEIKPLYSFLDEEIYLYAKLNGFQFKLQDKKKDPNKENKISFFLNNLEKTHPEVKRAVINSILKIEGDKNL